MTEEELARGKARLKLGSLLLYAFPGSPTLYYGDEAGMTGFEDPFNRGTFPWGREDQDLSAWFTALGKARRELLPLRRGTFSWLTCRGRVVSFARCWEGETLLTCVNAGEEPTTVKLPTGKRLHLEPLEGVLLREDGTELLSTCQKAM
jgi:glycosidase